jgi:hypothetical protein
MTEQIRLIHAMSDCTQGRDRGQAELSDMGLCVNHKRIARLMKLESLRGVCRRRGERAQGLCGDTAKGSSGPGSARFGKMSLQSDRHQSVVGG